MKRWKIGPLQKKNSSIFFLEFLHNAYVPFSFFPYQKLPVELTFNHIDKNCQNLFEFVMRRKFVKKMFFFYFSRGFYLKNFLLISRFFEVCPRTI